MIVWGINFVVRPKKGWGYILSVAQIPNPVV